MITVEIGLGRFSPLFNPDLTVPLINILKYLLQAEYLFFMCFAVLAIPGYIIGPWSCETIGRLKTFYHSSIGAAVFTATWLVCLGSSIWLYLELFVALTFYSIFNSALWIYTPEYYPSYIRTTSVGLINGIRLGV